MYPEPLSGIIFSGVFGGTYADANTYTTPSGSESWAGFANEDASIYPLTFGEGGSVTFTGSTDGASADIYFRFEFNPYPDTEPSYNTTSVNLGPEISEVLTVTLFKVTATSGVVTYNKNELNVFPP